MWTCTTMRLVVSGLCPSEDSAACAPACGAGSRKCGRTGHSAACEAVRGREGGSQSRSERGVRQTHGDEPAEGCRQHIRALVSPQPRVSAHRDLPLTPTARTYARTQHARTHARTHTPDFTRPMSAPRHSCGGRNAHDVPVRLRRRVVHAVCLEPRTATGPHPRLPASMDARLLRSAVACCASHASRYGVRCAPYTALHARPRRAHVRRQGVPDSPASVVVFEQERRERPLPACCQGNPCCTASLTGRARAS